MTVLDSSLAIKAIETHYAGCRFRSRLEARWGVFFNSIGWQWQYEPQGFTVGPESIPYLPDFWLPELDLWVEVKGVVTPKDFRTLVWAASEMGLPARPDGTDVARLDEIAQSRILLLGDVPEPDDLAGSIHWTFDQGASGRTVATRRFLAQTAQGVRPIQIYGSVPVMDMAYFEADEYTDLDRRFLADLTDTFIDVRVNPGRDVARGYRAARSARFEHGESG
jgi:hypothetical protein